MSLKILFTFLLQVIKLIENVVMEENKEKELEEKIDELKKRIKELEDKFNYQQSLYKYIEPLD
jgi:hypothetical protein